ncbi:hypothetical protein R6Q59_009910 [Mikania micrantha]
MDQLSLTASIVVVLQLTQSVVAYANSLQDVSTKHTKLTTVAVDLHSLLNGLHFWAHHLCYNYNERVPLRMVVCSPKAPGRGEAYRMSDLSDYVKLGLLTALSRKYILSEKYPYRSLFLPAACRGQKAKADHGVDTKSQNRLSETALLRACEGNQTSRNGEEDDWKTRRLWESGKDAAGSRRPKTVVVISIDSSSHRSSQPHQPDEDAICLTDLPQSQAFSHCGPKLRSTMFKLGRRSLGAALRATKDAPARASLQQQRNLSIHEYLSANLLRQYGVGVPYGDVAKTAEEAEAIAKKIGGDDMVIKAQVLAGGRGKGTFDNGLKGGVRVIYSPTEAKMFAGQMIGHKLVTKQTGAKGRMCNAVYICERKYARREFYLAILMDRATQGPVIVASSQGGMDIETVAKESPEAIITTPVDIHVGVTDEMGRKIATELGFSEQCIEDAKTTIQNLYKVFMEKDATQIEINPLSETNDHQVLAMDAKLGFDDNADFRQKEVFSWRDTSQEDADEVKAATFGLNFIKLDGDIGCLVNGAGLAMATMDIIKLNNGSPANFLDVGGGATPEAIKSAFELITSDAKVTAIFVNIFGGIVRCDAIAQGLINVVQEMNLKIPIVARLQGTNMEKARELIETSGMKIFAIQDLQQASEKVVEFSKIVKMARNMDVGVDFNLGI